MACLCPCGNEASGSIILVSSLFDIIIIIILLAGDFKFSSEKYRDMQCLKRFCHSEAQAYFDYYLSH